MIKTMVPSSSRLGGPIIHWMIFLQLIFLSRMMTVEGLIVPPTRSKSTAATTTINLQMVAPPRKTDPSPSDSTLASSEKTTTTISTTTSTRRELLIGGFVKTTATAAAMAACSSSLPQPALAIDVDVEDFLRSGMVAQPMGVSGQAGKSKPETGILLRDGSEVLQDSGTGNVLAEILVQTQQQQQQQEKKVMPVVATFTSKWKLATGGVFDVECRDASTGDSAFLAVTSRIGSGKTLDDLKDSFFVESLFSPLGRFSLYGQPTDVRVLKPKAAATKQQRDGREYRIIDVNFATLSQSTQTEIPRRAQIVATIPEGSSQAVMLVGSASAIRWKKGSDQIVGETIDSFRAISAPETSMKLREKQQR